MDNPENPNPIVAMAMRIRARKEIESALDSLPPRGASNPEAKDVSEADAGRARQAQTSGGGATEADAASALGAFAEALRIATKRLNSILGKNGVTFVRLERPLRLRVRFGEKRISLDLDAARQLVIVRGEGLDGEYQFDPGAPAPALINLSRLSTEAGYGEPLTASGVLKTLARDAELPRPAHLDGPGPLSF
jgi:hypothetical protein